MPYSCSNFQSHLFLPHLIKKFSDNNLLIRNEVCSQINRIFAEEIALFVGVLTIFQYYTLTMLQIQGF